VGVEKTRFGGVAYPMLSVLVTTGRVLSIDACGGGGGIIDVCIDLEFEGSCTTEGLDGRAGRCSSSVIALPMPFAS